MYRNPAEICEQCFGCTVPWESFDLVEQSVLLITGGTSVIFSNTR